MQAVSDCLYYYCFLDLYMCIIRVDSTGSDDRFFTESPTSKGTPRDPKSELKEPDLSRKG